MIEIVQATSGNGMVFELWEKTIPTEITGVYLGVFYEKENAELFKLAKERMCPKCGENTVLFFFNDSITQVCSTCNKPVTPGHIPQPEEAAKSTVFTPLLDAPAGSIISLPCETIRLRDMATLPKVTIKDGVLTFDTDIPEPDVVPEEEIARITSEELELGRRDRFPMLPAADVPAIREAGRKLYQKLCDAEVKPDVVIDNTPAQPPRFRKIEFQTVEKLDDDTMDPIFSSELSECCGAAVVRNESLTGTPDAVCALCGAAVPKQGG